MTTISNFMSTLATPASLAGSFVRTALVLTVASFVVWDERWAFTIPSRITLRTVAARADREIDLRATAFRSPVASAVKARRLAQFQFPNPRNEASSSKTQLVKKHGSKD